uniref:ATP synthase complex subunit 8 n=1 Tax=Hylurgops palliatus TaxID=202000 RepID=A0A343A5D4_9CUCU|nr:ATP synthase F0 subunit 8 [Hylurgops palliatus]
MPQMSPMSWTLLFILFNFTLILTMIINYFSFIYHPHYMKLTKSVKPINWIWKW